MPVRRYNFFVSDIGAHTPPTVNEEFKSLYNTGTDTPPTGAVTLEGEHWHATYRSCDVGRRALAPVRT